MDDIGRVEVVVGWMSYRSSCLSLGSKCATLSLQGDGGAVGRQNGRVPVVIPDPSNLVGIGLLASAGLVPPFRGGINQVRLVGAVENLVLQRRGL